MLLRKIMFKLKLWKRLFKRIGEHTIIANSIVVYHPENIEVGNHTIINEYALLNGGASIKIGDYVHVSSFCVINTSGLDYHKILAERTHIYQPVIIEDGVWLGSNAIINPGVTIGKNSVIGAGAVVTSDIPANSLAVGIPAKVIKRIDEN